MNGDGIAQYHVAGVEWYRRAAEQRDAKAQSNLDLAYLNGSGVPQDFVIALLWSNLASAQGNDSAKKNRDILEKRMTAKQIAEAERLGRIVETAQIRAIHLDEKSANSTSAS